MASTDTMSCPNISSASYSVLGAPPQQKPMTPPRGVRRQHNPGGDLTGVAKPPAGDSNAGSTEVRAEKVAALKAAIENGTYHVPASAIADRLIESLLRER